MNCFSYVIDLNIKRYRNLLDSSADETERRTIQTLLAEEIAIATAALQSIKADDGRAEPPRSPLSTSGP